MFEKHRAPEHLSSVAAAAFARIQDELVAAGAEYVGLDVVERYAVTYALWFECQARVRSEGMAWGDGSRNLRMIDLHKLNAAVAAIRRELGLGVLKVDGPSVPDHPTAGNDDATSRRVAPLRYNFQGLN